MTCLKNDLPRAGYCWALAAATLLTTTPALAEVEPGFYVGAGLGFQNRNRSAENDVIWTDWKNGDSLSALAGYRFNKRWRLDVEWARFHNDADVLSGGLTPTGFQLVGNASGNAVLNTVFINGNVDFEVHPQWTLSLGLGFGRMTSRVNDLTNELISGAGFIFDGESKDWIDTWQLKASLSYALNEDFEVYGQYRRVKAGKLRFLFHLPNGLDFSAGPRDTTIDSGEIGLRYYF